MEQRNIGTWSNVDKIPVALTIAGSDSGGGAGIQADLRTFSANGVFGTSVITAITSQNPKTVKRVDAVSLEGIRAQIEAVFDVMNVRAMKSGMLFSAEIIHTVAQCIANKKCPLVVDPVMISTSRVKLLKDDALETLQKELLPLADWITPNIPEAELLSGRRITCMDDAKAAAETIAEKWDTCVILKGGHAEGDSEATDIICDTQQSYKLTTPRLLLPPYAAHGTGCTLSSALAAALARGMTDKQALIHAKAFVLGSLAEAKNIGTATSGVFGMFPPVELEKYKNKIMIGRL